MSPWMRKGSHICSALVRFGFTHRFCTSCLEVARKQLSKFLSKAPVGSSSYLYFCYLLFFHTSKPAGLLAAIAMPLEFLQSPLYFREHETCTLPDCWEHHALQRQLLRHGHAHSAQHVPARKMHTPWRSQSCILLIISATRKPLRKPTFDKWCL